jgi:hypothetical protein
MDLSNSTHSSCRSQGEHEEVSEARKVFESRKLEPTCHPKEFAPLEHMKCDDELVYSTSPVPALCFTRKLGGRKSLTFESLFVGCYSECLVDSGATNSFVSLNFMRDNNVSFTLVSALTASLADGSPCAIVGIARNMRVSIGHFVFNEDFLVVDISNLQVVLGMPFLQRYNPYFDWQQRIMHVEHTNTHHALPAISVHSYPTIDSDRFELCSFSALSKRALSSAVAQEAMIGCIIPEFFALQTAEDAVDPLLSGPGAHHPVIRPVLQEFSDVLQTEIPGGLPPERFAADGSRIEHCIEVADKEKPYARTPMPFTSEEETEIRKYITDFLSKGWIVPSLSPWAAPVLFVPKKVDPITGEKT